MQNFTPIGRMCLILPAKEPEKTKGGIILVTNKESSDNFNNFQTGVVAKKGTLPTPDFHERDTVLFPRGCGIKQDIDGVEYLIVKYDDIVAVTF